MVKTTESEAASSVTSRYLHLGQAPLVMERGGQIRFFGSDPHADLVGGKSMVLLPSPLDFRRTRDRISENHGLPQSKEGGGTILVPNNEPCCKNQDHKSHDRQSQGAPDSTRPS